MRNYGEKQKNHKQIDESDGFQEAGLQVGTLGQSAFLF